MHNINSAICHCPLFWHLALIVAVAGYAATLPEREEVIPERKSFETFPLRVDAWKGVPDILESQYLTTLKLSDYLLADYADPDYSRVNFYIAYYDSQRKGVSAHSPRSCLPGGGWQIDSLEEKTISEVEPYGNGEPLRVNRVFMSYGEQKTLVYYWFQQRGRIITNEYLVKWYLFLDSLQRNRTDGALVRVYANIGEGQSVEEVDQLLVNFIENAVPQMSPYIPE